jgi:hypothetical protein
LLLSAFPTLGADAQEAALRGGALDLGAAGPDDSYGAGRVDVLASYTNLGTVPPPPPPPPPAFLRDGFESGDLRAWSSSTGKGLSVVARAALTGAFGLELTPGKGPSRVNDAFVAGQPAIRIGVKLAARSLAGFASPWADIVEGQGAQGNQLFAVQMRAVTTGIQIRLSGRRPLFDIVSEPIAFPAGTHSVVVVWQPAAEGLTLTLDGALRASVATLPARTLGRISVGAPGPLVWRTGTLAVDDYESTRP